MSDKEYLSFDEVISDLHMEEEELKRLVSAGEIRAFRDQDTMRFKAADIDRLKATPEADDLDLGDELELTDDLDFESQVSDGDELILEDDLGDLGGDVEEVDLGGGDDEASQPRRRAPRSQVAAPEEATEGGLVVTMLVVGMLVLIFANFAALGAVSGQTNGLTNFLAQLFA